MTRTAEFHSFPFRGRYLRFIRCKQGFNRRFIFLEGFVAGKLPQCPELASSSLLRSLRDVCLILGRALDDDRLAGRTGQRQGHHAETLPSYARLQRSEHATSTSTEVPGVRQFHSISSTGSPLLGTQLALIPRLENIPMTFDAVSG